jgi:hypothetical protein
MYSNAGRPFMMRRRIGETMAEIMLGILVLGLLALADSDLARRVGDRVREIMANLER